MLCTRSGLSSWHPILDFLLLIQALYFERKLFSCLPDSLPLLLSPLLLAIPLSCLSLSLVTWVLPEFSLSSHTKTMQDSSIQCVKATMQNIQCIHATEILVQSLKCHLTFQAKAGFITLIHPE